MFRLCRRESPLAQEERDAEAREAAAIDVTPTEPAHAQIEGEIDART